MDNGPKIQKITKFPYIKVVILLSLGFFSCGGPDDLKPRPKTSFFGETSSLLQEGQCDEGKTPKPSDLEKEINSLHEKALEFTYQYNQNHYPYLQAPGQVLNLNLLSSNPLRPLVLNESLLKEELKDLNTRWTETIGKENLHFTNRSQVIASAKPAVVERIESVNQTHQLISTLREKVKRYNSQLCNLEQLMEREKRDVRPMHEFVHALNEHSSLDHPHVEKELIEMCETFNTPGVCQMELLLVKRKKTTAKMKDHYLNLFQKREETFFNHRPNTKFQCHKEEEKTVLVLPIEKNETLKTKLFGSYQSLKETIEDKWSNKDIRVVVQMVDPNPNAVKIKWGETSLSFVNASNPKVITMAKTLNFSQLIITLTHEIGHVFGFSDCYHEFFDRSNKSIVYYSLDESGKNLMCNLNFNTTVPDNYLTQLVQKNCQ